MRALILYPLFVVCGSALAIMVGLFIEKEFSQNVSLVVFLAMFFATFYVAWRITAFIVERTIARTASGRPVG